jgi:hypothetical protein
VRAGLTWVGQGYNRECQSMVRQVRLQRVLLRVPAE